MIDLATSNDSFVLELLRSHPRVREAALGDAALRFHLGPWVREVRVGDVAAEHKGLMELMDNNPVVCANVVSVPTPASTLALIALGPLAAAGLIIETPTLMANTTADEREIFTFLQTVGWEGGIVYQETDGPDSVVAATAMAVIQTPDDLEDIDELFDERYGRSFFVHRDEDLADCAVTGSAHAFYRLRITPDDPNSLLTVHVLADRQGKCGAAQIVHAMNVMCGFEESLGLE